MELSMYDKFFKTFRVEDTKFVRREYRANEGFKVVSMDAISNDVYLYLQDMCIAHVRNAPTEEILTEWLHLFETVNGDVKKFQKMCLSIGSL